MCCNVCDIWPQLSAWLSCHGVPCLVLSVLCTQALQVWPTPAKERRIIKVISMIIQLTGLLKGENWDHDILQYRLFQIHIGKLQKIKAKSGQF